MHKGVFILTAHNVISIPVVTVRGCDDKVVAIARVWLCMHFPTEHTRMHKDILYTHTHDHYYVYLFSLLGVVMVKWSP